MRRLSLLACMVFALAAHAEDAAKSVPGGMIEETRQAAAALARSLGSEGTLGHMLDVMRSQIQTSIAARNPQADVKKALDDIIMPELRQHLGELNTVIADIWAARFTLEELKSLRSFYETPLGRKSLRMLQQIAVESQNAGTKWAQDVFRDIVEKHADELKALGVTPTTR